jgi:hypothetical protein
MIWRFRTGRLLGFGLAFGAAAAVVWAQGTPVLGMLDRIEPGRWEFHSHQPGVASETICVPDGHRLIQLRHPGVPCESYIVEDRPDQVTVQYSCRGRGYGRTHIRRENGRLIQLETQGIAHGAPFELAAEGRRIGPCALAQP